MNDGKGADSDLEQMRLEMERLRQENVQLRKMLGLVIAEPGLSKKPPLTSELPIFSEEPLPSVTVHSTIQEKLALFRTLFKGREDVYAAFWVSDRTGKKGFSPACENPWDTRREKQKKYFPLTDQVIQSHLKGSQTIGVFPLLQDHTCWFLACDFDGEGWTLDALGLLKISRQYGAPVYLERSRSGNGGHVWLFFSSPVSAVSARQLGTRLLRETMVIRGEMDLASYDRFFPNQDFVPKGGFGNLIALPFQKHCRSLGNTEFLNPEDPDLRSWPDQWAFLSQVQRLTPSQMEGLLKIVPPVAVGPGTRAKVSEVVLRQYPAPRAIQCTVWTGLSVEKSGIPPWLLSQLKHLASFHNPQFYERQKLRFSTFQIPRFIKCYEEDASHLHLPRGILGELEELCKNAETKLSLTDQRPTFDRLSLKFKGELTPPQRQAMRAVLAHDMGVLVAPPGAGKTVMGCFAVAQRNVPTLILAHRKPILEQWRTQLMEHLGLASRQIGQVGGGRHRRSGIVDLGMLQSLKSVESLEDFFSDYGFLIVDECHHLPAFTFEACVKRASIRHILGLTATPYRRDGLQDIITLQCGPIRYKMQDAESGLQRRLIIRQASFSRSSQEVQPIQDLFRELVNHSPRNQLILEDVAQALSQGRRCLVLSQRREHCRILAQEFMKTGTTPFVLDGSMGKKDRMAVLKSIHEMAVQKSLLIIATGQYLGEGFDCPQIDTLFLAFPVSFKGKLVQYVGRILREHEDKQDVVVYDYADIEVPVLRRMHLKRLNTYKALGFHEEGASSDELLEPLSAALIGQGSE